MQQVARKKKNRRKYTDVCDFFDFQENQIFELFKRVLVHFGAIFEPLDPGPTLFIQIFIIFS